MEQKSAQQIKWERRLRKARRTNEQRDAIDRTYGFAPPAECGLKAYLDTAIEAINSGGILEDWDCVAEGLAMLQDISNRLKELSDGKGFVYRIYLK